MRSLVLMLLLVVAVFSLSGCAEFLEDYSYSHYGEMSSTPSN